MTTLNDKIRAELLSRELARSEVGAIYSTERVEPDLPASEVFSRGAGDEFASSFGNASRFVPGQAHGTAAEFLKPTKEDTTTWGNTAAFTFQTVNGVAPVVPTQQLIHIARRRPTTFSVITVLTLGTGWTGESSWFFQMLYILGVGQTNLKVIRTIAIPVPTNGQSVILTPSFTPVAGQPASANSTGLVDIFPANAIQASATFFGPSVNMTGTKTARVDQLAAPVYA